jgi:hypothetical protein
MRWKQLLLFLLLVVISPAGGQRLGGYFSISTNKTFLPGEKVGIRVFSTGVDALEFRVYRIKNPIAFIEHLDDPHQFGHMSPREQIETPSLLERFHDWKYRCWVEIRDFPRSSVLRPFPRRHSRTARPRAKREGRQRRHLCPGTRAQ